ncbi:MAG: hypothetical protein QXE92_00355 [Thermofilaceae archaeon]
MSIRLGSLLEERLNIIYEMRCEGLEKITPHLIGPAGIGKSTFVYEWAMRKARELGLEFVDADFVTPENVDNYLDGDRFFIFKDWRLTSLDPVDLSGQPRPVNSKYVAFLPLVTARLLNACPGVLFLDEFMNENRQNMKAAAFKVVRDYKIGDIALNPKTIVIAASNTSKYSSIVSSMPKPLRDRFDFIEVEAPTIEDWADWMDRTYGRERWDREVLAYLMWRPSDFLANVEDVVEDEGWEPPATPRGWSYVALAFKKIKGKKLSAEEEEKMLYSIAKGKLGRVGESLMAFLENKVPRFEELVEKPEVIRRFKVEQKYLAALTVAEAINANAKNIAKAKAFIKYVAEADDREFISALFAFLQRHRRSEVYMFVKDDEKIVRCLELTGRALL